MLKVARGRAAGFAVAVVFTLGACSDSENKDESCKQTDPTSCASGLSCEQVGDETFACLPPVLVTGRVFDSLTGAGLAGATVVGLDANGAARTAVVRSGASGSYELPVSVRRTADHKPTKEILTLRVAANEHQPFPTAPRTALPLDLSLAQLPAGQDATQASYRLQNAATDVALVPLPEDQRGGVAVEGRIDGAGAGSALIVALYNDKQDATAIADRDGKFVLFNVTPGAVRLEGYRAGVEIAPETVQVPAAGVTGITLHLASTPLSTVSGSVNIVNAEGGATTSVILVVASTFDPVMIRGEAPAGLRAANVGGAFTISGVAQGRYAVLAAFENDRLVRDPDQGIGGTDVVFVNVPSTGGTVVLPTSFKVTQALEVISPGAQTITEVQAGPLTLSWVDDSSEDGYELRIYDALGTLVHEDLMVPRKTSGNVTYDFDASGLAHGMMYQFRALSWRDRQGGRTAISATEDLLGVFQIAR